MKILTTILLVIFTITTQAQNWSIAGSGVGGSINVESVYNGKLYVGGNFLTAGGISCNQLAVWDGSDWDSIPDVPGTNEVSGLKVYNNELYVSRNSPPYIHRWDGTSWSNVSVGLNNVAKAMVEYNSALYVGGEFTIAGGNIVNYIAKWDGSIWTAVGTGFNGEVSALAVYNNELYAAGTFTGSYNHIAKWDGATWTSLSLGITGGNVHSLAVYNNELYVGGEFTMAGGISAQYIARWNGTNWNTVSTGVDAGFAVGPLAVYYGELYAGGLFNMIGGVSAQNIASWNGSTWSPLGTGLNHVAYALCEFNNGLYAGGIFATAGGQVANGIARWNVAAGVDDLKNENEIRVFPVPASSNLNISINDNIAATFVLHDITARIVLKKEINRSATIDINKLTRGIYLFEIRDKDTVLKKGKVVIE